MVLLPNKMRTAQHDPQINKGELLYIGLSVHLRYNAAARRAIANNIKAKSRPEALLLASLRPGLE